MTTIQITKVFALISLATLFPIAIAKAETNKEFRDLYIESCLADNAVDQSFCQDFTLGFIRGMQNSGMIDHILTHGPEAENPEFPTQRFGICLPNSTSVSTVIDYIRIHSRRGTEQSSPRVGLFIWEALLDEFGCERETISE